MLAPSLHVNYCQYPYVFFEVVYICQIKKASNGCEMKWVCFNLNLCTESQIFFFCK